MNKLIIVLIIVFLAIFYVYTFLKIRKNKKKKEEVSERSGIVLKDEAQKEDLLLYDYIERDKLHKIIQEELHPNDNVNEQVKLRKFEF